MQCVLVHIRSFTEYHSNAGLLLHFLCSWLYNLFSSYIADDLKGSLSDQVRRDSDPSLYNYRCQLWPAKCRNQSVDDSERKLTCRKSMGLKD